jgi:hypothetical protein
MPTISESSKANVCHSIQSKHLLLSVHVDVHCVYRLEASPKLHIDGKDIAVTMQKYSGYGGLRKAALLVVRVLNYMNCTHNITCNGS